MLSESILLITLCRFWLFRCFNLHKLINVYGLHLLCLRFSDSEKTWLGQCSRRDRPKSKFVTPPQLAPKSRIVAWNVDSRGGFKAKVVEEGVTHETAKSDNKKRRAKPGKTKCESKYIIRYALKCRYFDSHRGFVVKTKAFINRVCICAATNQIDRF